MPSTSPAQARLMAAAAHTKGGFGGVPQSVGHEFNEVDKGTGIRKHAGKLKKRGLISNRAHEKWSPRPTKRVSPKRKRGWNTDDRGPHLWRASRNSAGYRGNA